MCLLVGFDTGNSIVGDCFEPTSGSLNDYSPATEVSDRCRLARTSEGAYTVHPSNVAIDAGAHATLFL